MEHLNVPPQNYVSYHLLLVTNTTYCGGGSMFRLGYKFCAFLLQFNCNFCVILHFHLYDRLYITGYERTYDLNPR